MKNGKDSRSIVIDVDLWDQFKVEASKRKTTMSSVMESLIKEWMGLPPEPEVPPHLQRLLNLLKRNFTNEREADALMRAIKEMLIFSGRGE